MYDNCWKANKWKKDILVNRSLPIIPINQFTPHNSHTPPTQPRPLDHVGIYWFPIIWITRQKCSGPYKLDWTVDYVKNAMSNMVCLYTSNSLELILDVEDIWAPVINYAAYMEIGAPKTWQFSLLVQMSKKGNSHADGRIGKAEGIYLQQNNDCP
jgi:hypothetical protein